MNDLFIDATANSPLIKFNYNNGAFEINGKSYMSNPQLFYRPLISWIDEYVRTPQQHAVVDVKLEQCDDDSTKQLLFIFQKISKLKHFSIGWYYADEQMLQLGEDISSMLGITFDFRSSGHAS